MTRLTVEELVTLNRRAVTETGGTHAVLKPNVLESAVLRPYQEVFGQTLYPMPWDKAGAVAETIAHDHPFVDGNKRTATLAAMRVLEDNGWSLEMRSEECGEFVQIMVDLAAGESRWGRLSEWLRTHVEPLSK